MWYSRLIHYWQRRGVTMATRARGKHGNAVQRGRESAMAWQRAVAINMVMASRLWRVTEIRGL
eukprot:9814381-Lingulodinium_polyedra.AAC.1